MLKYYYLQSKELERCRRKYEEAAYRVYRTIPNGVNHDHEMLHGKMAELLEKKNLDGRRKKKKKKEEEIKSMK